MASASDVAEQLQALEQEYQRSRAFLEALEAQMSKRDETVGNGMPASPPAVPNVDDEAKEKEAEKSKAPSTLRSKLTSLFRRQPSKKEKVAPEPAEDEADEELAQMQKQRRPSIVTLGSFGPPSGGALSADPPALASMPSMRRRNSIERGSAASRCSMEGEMPLNGSFTSCASRPGGALTPTLRRTSTERFNPGRVSMDMRGAGSFTNGSCGQLSFTAGSRTSSSNIALGQHQHQQHHQHHSQQQHLLPDLHLQRCTSSRRLSNGAPGLSPGPTMVPSSTMASHYESPTSTPTGSNTASAGAHAPHPPAADATAPQDSFRARRTSLRNLDPNSPSPCPPDGTSPNSSFTSRRASFRNVPPAGPCPPAAPPPLHVRPGSSRPGSRAGSCDSHGYVDPHDASPLSPLGGAHAVTPRDTGSPTARSPQAGPSRNASLRTLAPSNLGAGAAGGQCLSPVQARQALGQTIGMRQGSSSGEGPHRMRQQSVGEIADEHADAAAGMPLAAMYNSDRGGFRGTMDIV